MSTQYRPVVRNWIVVVICFSLAGSMAGLAYAAVPLYQLFCQVTGFAGTTQVATSAPGVSGERMMEIRFDANVSSSLAWKFKPQTRTMSVRLGESSLGFYSATNLSAVRTAGTATFNVTPLAAGQYFNKVDCFCFTEQVLEAGMSADLLVSFFIDPEIENDPDLDEVKTVTLSYTYFPVELDNDQTRLDATEKPGQAPTT